MRLAGWLVALALAGLLVVTWAGARAATMHALAADSLYRATKAADSAYRHEQTALARARADSLRVADSASAADSLRLADALAARERSDARARERLAAAHTVEEERDAYRDLYHETVVERDDALRLAEDQRRTVGHLRAILAADSTLLYRAEQRGDQWERTADSLDAANRDLLRHRGIQIKLGGVKTMAVGAGIVELIRLVAGHP